MIYRTMCLDCRHYVEDEEGGQPTCAAFPGGIPDDIMRKGYDHRQPYPNDGGIMFEPEGPVDQAFLDKFTGNTKVTSKPVSVQIGSRAGSKPVVTS